MNVELAIFDVAGRRVRVLVDGWRGGGTHEVIWDGTDGAGRKVSSGMYLARMIAPDRTQVKRMTLLK